MLDLFSTDAPTGQPLDLFAEAGGKPLDLFGVVPEEPKETLMSGFVKPTLDEIGRGFKDIGQKVVAVNDLAETAKQTAKGLTYGMVGFADSVYARVMDSVKQLVVSGKIDPQAVKIAGEQREKLYAFEPTDPGAELALGAMASVPAGIKQLFQAPAEAIDKAKYPNLYASLMTIGDIAELAAFGKVFETIKIKTPDVLKGVKAEGFDKTVAKEGMKEAADIKGRPLEKQRQAESTMEADRVRAAQEAEATRPFTEVHEGVDVTRPTEELIDIGRRTKRETPYEGGPVDLFAEEPVAPEIIYPDMEAQMRKGHAAALKSTKGVKAEYGTKERGIETPIDERTLMGPRTVSDIAKDINAVVGKKGAIGDLGKLTPEQKIAYDRLSGDVEKIKSDADKLGKSVGAYLVGRRVDPKVAALIHRYSKQVQTPAGMVGKGDSVGEGQKARSFAVGSAGAEVLAAETKAGIAGEIKPGGRGAYTPESQRAVQAKAQKKVELDTEKAVRSLETARNPGAEHTAVGIELVKKFNNEGNYERSADIALTLSKRLTRAGQEISAAKLMGELSPEGVLVVAQREIAKTNEKITKVFGKKLFPKWVKDLELKPETAQKLSELAKAIKETTDPKLKVELAQELQQHLNALRPSGFLRKVATVQTIAQLLNPKTQVRNIFGNELFYRMERISKYPSTLIDWAASKVTGERTVTFRTGGKGGYWEGWLQGAKAGWKGVNVKGLETQFDLGKGMAFDPKGNPASKFASFFERTTYASLKSFDQAAYNRAYNQTLYELSALKVKNETGKMNSKLAEKTFKAADENLQNIAHEYGKYVTFQDNNVISVGLGKVKRGLNLGLDFGGGDIIIKYPKTPGALLARGLEYSPAGFLKAAYEAAQPILKNKKLDQRAVAMSIGRAITGTTGLTGLGYFFADKGIITGPADKDRDAANLQRTMGTHPYKINITAFYRWVKSDFDPKEADTRKGDTFYSYDWAQPVSMSIAAGASIATRINERKTFSKAFKETMMGAPGIAMEATAAAVGSLAEQPVLQGLLRLTGGKGGAEGLANNIANLATEVPASFGPTMISQIRQLMDNTRRETYDSDLAKKSYNKLINKVPWMEESLPVAYDTLGYKKDLYQGESNTPFNVMMNPGFISKFYPTAEEEKIIRVWKETGSTKQIPRVVGKTIGLSIVKNGTKDTVQVELTPQEYTKLQKVVGAETRKRFGMIKGDANVVSQEIAMVHALTYAGMMGRRAIMKDVEKRIQPQLVEQNIKILRPRR